MGSPLIGKDALADFERLAEPLISRQGILGTGIGLGLKAFVFGAPSTPPPSKRTSMAAFTMASTSRVVMPL